MKENLAHLFFCAKSSAQDGAETAKVKRIPDFALNSHARPTPQKGAVKSAVIAAWQHISDLTAPCFSCCGFTCPLQIYSQQPDGIFRASDNFRIRLSLSLIHI